MASSTRSRVAGFTCVRPLMTRETVALPTPAIRATSEMRGAPLPETASAFTLETYGGRWCASRCRFPCQTREAGLSFARSALEPVPEEEDHDAKVGSLPRRA